MDRTAILATAVKPRTPLYLEHTVGKHLLKLALLVAALTAGCATKPAPVAEPGPLPLKTFTRKWGTQIPTSAGAIEQVYVREDLVFAYTTDGTSYVCSRANGNLLHSEKMTAGLAGTRPPVVYKDFIVYPTVTSLEIFDRRDGHFNRRVELPAASRSPAIGSKSLLFIGVDYSGGGRVICMDLSREYVPVKWALMYPGSAMSAAPVAIGETVFCGGEDGRVTAVAAENREGIWNIGFFKTDGPILGDLAGDETGVYVASGDSKLYCINRQSGKVKWQYFSGSPLKVGPTVTKDLVYIYVAGSMVALDKLAAANDPKSPQFDRHPKWSVDGGRQFLAEDETYAYLMMGYGKLAAISKTSGTVEFESKRGDFVAAGMNAKDGVIYAATSGNRLMAIERVIKAGTVGEVVLAQPSEPPVELARVDR